MCGLDEHERQQGRSSNLSLFRGPLEAKNSMGKLLTRQTFLLLSSGRVFSLMEAHFRRVSPVRARPPSPSRPPASTTTRTEALFNSSFTRQLESCCCCFWMGLLKPTTTDLCTKPATPYNAHVLSPMAATYLLWETNIFQKPDESHQW